MGVEYDNYYQSENLFGEPYPELIDFYSSIQKRGNLLDVGCGQGRDSIALAKLGYTVTGIDYSRVGIDQLNRIRDEEKLSLKGVVCDIYTYQNYGSFEFILLDSMFHFGKKEKEQEKELLFKIIEQSKQGTLITICIQNTGKKLEVLNSILSKEKRLVIINQVNLTYKFEDKKSNHKSTTSYEMITIEKLKGVGTTS